MPAFESWIDRQIREAMERGEFDNLPGAGKPIEDLGRRRDGDWWIKRKLEREGISPVLPTTLSLRKEASGIGEVVSDLRSEDQVREVVADLNARIRAAVRRPVDGPPLVLRTVDVERVVRDWRDRGFGAAGL